MAPVFDCKQCGDKFVNFRNLSRHLKTHDKNMCVSCQYCTFTTERKDSLKRHSNKYHSVIENVAKDVLVPPDPITSVGPNMVSTPVVPSTGQVAHNHSGDFDKRLQLPHNFIYAGATQSVSFPY